jgi:undecaprenyl-diphosphatase
MNILQGIILGIVQGLTEFLPISSTAHVTVTGKWMGLISLDHPEQWTAFIAVIQLGTLAAVLLYFLRDIIEITLSFLKENLGERRKFRHQSLQSRLGWYVIIGSLPVCTLGIVFKKIIEGHLTKSMLVISLSLIILALILAFAELTARFSKSLQKITWLDSLCVGFAQALSLIPGSSRSGTTITAGLLVGMKRDVAARFSFLLSIPAVLASGLLQFWESLRFMNSQDMMVMAVSTAVSAVSGYAAIAFLLRFLRSHSTFIFVFYRIALGSILLWLALRYDFS